MHRHMTWLKLMLTHFMVALMVWMPLFSHAGYTSLQKTEDMSADDFSLLQKTQDNYKNLGFELKLDPENKRALLFNTKSENKNPVMEIPYGEETELKKFSPNSFNKELLKGLANARPGETFQHTIKRLPWESFIFSVAIGSVIASQLITDYSANPMAMQQHIEHQLSSFGVFSFFVFMC